MQTEKKPHSSLAFVASEYRRYKTVKTILPILISCIALLLVIVYIVSVLYTKYGSFTVSVNKFDNLNYSLSLSETKDFNRATSRLNCNTHKVLTNIDGSMLDNSQLGVIDGEDNGENYMCYSFYCQNSGNGKISYQYSISIKKMTLDIEKAVRIRVITNKNGENGTVTDYARANSTDEQGNTICEPDTVPFLDKNTVVSEDVQGFAPGDVCKYTIVIWLEGNDPDCIDSIIGGEFKIDMNFSVIGIEENN